MKLHCTYCDFEGTTEDTVVTEEATGYMLRCPDCTRLIVELPYIDQLSEEEMALIPAKYLPNSDQCRYLQHLCKKQLTKIENARHQLQDLLAKNEVLEELAKEREGE